MERPEILVIGSYNGDLTLVVERFPAPGETCSAHRSFEAHGGKGSNQAVQAALFPTRVSILAAVGDDARGAAALSFWRAQGICCDQLLRVEGAVTGRALILLDRNGENQIVLEAGANGCLCPSAIEQRFERLAKPAVALGQMEIEPAATARAFQLAREAGAITILNAAPVGLAPAALLASTDFLIVNALELEQLAELMTEPSSEPAHRRIMGRFPCTIVVTKGADGAVLYNPQGLVAEERPPTVDAVDTTGAGDAFVGAFAAQLALIGDIKTALRWGVAAGAFACLGYGAAPSFGSAEAIARQFEEVFPLEVPPDAPARMRSRS